MVLCGLTDATGTTGTLYEPGESPPSYDGAPMAGSPYAWVGKFFYRVPSGGHELDTDRGVIRVAFERPTARGSEDRERAVTAAKTHIGNNSAGSGSTSTSTSRSTRQPRRVMFQPRLVTTSLDSITDVVHTA